MCVPVFILEKLASVTGYFGTLGPMCGPGSSLFGSNTHEIIDLENTKIMCHRGGHHPRTGENRSQSYL